MSLKMVRVHIELAMFDYPPRIGLGFEHCNRTDYFCSLSRAAVGLSLPPAVHEYESLLLRRPGFNPTVLIRVSSQPQHHALLLGLEEMRRNPIGLRRRAYTGSEQRVQVRGAKIPATPEPASGDLASAHHPFDRLRVQPKESGCVRAIPDRL